MKKTIFTLVLFLVHVAAWAVYSDFSFSVNRCPGGSSTHATGPLAPSDIIVYTNGSSSGYPVTWANASFILEHVDGTADPFAVGMVVRYPNICGYHSNWWDTVIWQIAGVDQATNQFSVMDTNTLDAGMCSALYQCFPHAPGVNAPSLTVVRYTQLGPTRLLFDEPESGPCVEMQINKPGPGIDPDPSLSVNTVPEAPISVYYSETVGANWTLFTSTATDSIGVADVEHLPISPDQMFYKIVTSTNSP